MSLVVFPAQLKRGVPEDITDVTANLVALRDVVNGLIEGLNVKDGSLQNAEVNASAGIALTKIAHRPFTQVWNNTTPSVPNGTGLIVPFTNSRQSTPGMFNAATNTRVVFNRDGVFRVYVRALWLTNVTQPSVKLMLNGAVVGGAMLHDLSSFINVGQGFGALVTGIAGDYLELKLEHADGSAKFALGGTEGNIVMSVMYLGRAT